MIELAMDGQHRMDYRAMLGWGQDAAAAAKRLEDPALRAAGVAAARARGRLRGRAPNRPKSIAAEAARLVDALTDAELARRLDAASHLAGAELYLHRYLDAGAHAERALAVGRATGQGQLFPLVYAILGMVWLFTGRLGEAVEPLDGAIEAARLTGNAHTIAWSLYARANIALAAGDLDTAIDHRAGSRRPHQRRQAQPRRRLGRVHARPGRARDRPPRAGDRAARDRHRRTRHAADRRELPRLRPRAPHPLPARARRRRRRTAGRRLRRGERRRCAAPMAHAWAQRAAAEVALHTGDAAGAAELALARRTSAEAVGAPLESALSRAARRPGPRAQRRPRPRDRAARAGRGRVRPPRRAALPRSGRARAPPARPAHPPALAARESRRRRDRRPSPDASSRSPG